MLVSNFDSNGLIFGLNQRAMNESSDALYLGALRRIVNAQGFLAFPLVNKPLLRENVNNMTVRPTYRAGGDVTHVCSKRGPDLIVHDIVGLTEWKANDPILPAIVDLFSRLKDEPSSPPLALVNGQRQRHEAIWTVRELVAPRFQNWLLSSLRETIGTSQEGEFTSLSATLQRFMKASFELYHVLSEQRSVVSDDVLQGLYTTIHEGLSIVHLEHLLDGTGGRRVLESVELADHELTLSHVMRYGAAGVLYDDTTPEARKESQLAARLLSKANDFDYIVTYPLSEASELLLVKMETIQKQDGTLRWHPYSAPLSDIAPLLFGHDEPKPMFVRPHPLFLTGEGPLRWPSVVSIDELNNIHGCIWLLGLLAKWEQWGKKKLKKASYDINGKQQARHKLTLGQICRNLKSEGMSDTKLPRRKLIEWRNELVHNLSKNTFSIPGYETVRRFLKTLHVCGITISNQEKKRRIAASITRQKFKEMEFTELPEREVVLMQFDQLFPEGEVIRMHDVHQSLRGKWFSPQTMFVDRKALKRHFELGIDPRTSSSVFFGRIKTESHQ